MVCLVDRLSSSGGEFMQHPNLQSVLLNFAKSLKQENMKSLQVKHEPPSDMDIIKPAPRYVKSCPNSPRPGSPRLSISLHKTQNPLHFKQKTKFRQDKMSPTNTMVTEWLSDMEVSPEPVSNQDKLLGLKLAGNKASTLDHTPMSIPTTSTALPTPQEKEKFIMIQAFKRDKLLARELITIHDNDMTEVNISFKRSSPQTPHTTNFIPFTLPASNLSSEFRRYFRGGISIFCKRGGLVSLNKSTSMKTMYGMQSRPAWSELKHNQNPVAIFNFDNFKSTSEEFNSSTFCNENTVRLSVGWEPHPEDIYKTEFHIKLSFSQD